MTTNLPSIIGPANLAALASLAQSAPVGAFVEVGVYRGGSAEVLYKIAHDRDATLHLFDTFIGTPIASVEQGDRHQVDDEFLITNTEFDNIIATMPNAELYVGTYPDTDPGDAALGPLAFVHCDCDQYASYRAVIDLMWPRVVLGGVLLFDDYPYLLGARRAVEESFEKSELELTPAGRFFVRKR